MTDEEKDSFKNEIAYKIYNSSIQRYPYAHSETSNFLPSSLFDEILANWPQPNDFKTNLESGSIKGVDQLDKEHPYNFRYQICLTDDKEILQINEKRLTFWKNFTEILTCPQVIQALIALYSNNLLKRFNFSNLVDLFSKIKYQPKLHLLHDKKNYSLGPHTDNSGKVVVVLIYFESDREDNTQSSFGTSVYIPREKGFLCKTGEHHLREKFIRVYSAKFRKNNAFSFCRGDNSFHGVEQVQDKAVERKLLQYSLYGVLKENTN